MKLDQFLKFQGIAATGGQAKLLIQSGEVEVNGQIECRRGRQLLGGDIVTVGNQTVSVNPVKSPNQGTKVIQPDHS
jgi:ribosome-associated protein